MKKQILKKYVNYLALHGSRKIPQVSAQVAYQNRIRKVLNLRPLALRSELFGKRMVVS